MAKKNLQSLMSGIMGSDSDSDTAARKEERQTEGSRSPKPGLGRPIKNDNTHATFVISEAQLRKIKIISVLDGCQQKDTIAKALGEYINKWEAENGKIPSPKN